MQYAIILVILAAVSCLTVQGTPIDAQGMSSFLVRSDTASEELPDYYKARLYNNALEEDPIAEFNKELMSRSVDALETAAAEDRENIDLEQQDSQGNSVWARDTLKRHNLKRNNNYYMSLCHFKICNMGRKRTTRRLRDMLHYNNWQQAM